MTDGMRYRVRPTFLIRATIVTNEEPLLPQSMSELGVNTTHFMKCMHQHIRSELNMLAFVIAI